MSKDNKKNVIQFKRATPPVLLPVLQEGIKADNLQIDTNKTDNLKQDYLLNDEKYPDKSSQIKQISPQIDNLKDNRQIDTLEVDNLKQDYLKIDKTYISVEPRCKVLIRNALLEALGDKDEVMINQLQMRKEIKVAYQTWVNHITVLRETEFVLIRQPHGTILRRRK